MKETDFLKLISGATRSPAASLMRGGLRVMSLGYQGVIGMRNWLFDEEWLSVMEPGVPVISIGNLTAGGTGKTPVVAWLAERLKNRGWNPALLSRGYRSGADGENDEKKVLDRLCPSVVHLQNPNRRESAAQAITEHDANALILDDGFQHRRIARDLDIVLIDVTNPWGYGSILPRGLLREPKSSLERADAIVLTRCDQRSPAEREVITSEVRRWNRIAPVIEVSFPIRGLVDAEGNRSSLADWSGHPIAALCGIGHPTAFLESLTRREFSIVSTKICSDHERPSESELEAFANSARKSGADAILMTVKDLVKIPTAEIGGLPLLAVEIETEVEAGADHLTRLLNKVTPMLRRAVA